MTAPFSATGPFVNPDAMMAAASLVQREWGHTGYMLAVADGNRLVTIFEVSHYDGSRFNVAADKWGNARGLSDDPGKAHDELAEMRDVARGN